MIFGNEQVFSSREKLEMSKLSSYKNLDYKKLNNKRLKEVSQEFESLFLNQMFKTMRNTIPKDDMLNGGLKQEIFEDMLDNEYAVNMSKSGGIGLGDLVYRYLINSK